MTMPFRVRKQWRGIEWELDKLESGMDSNEIPAQLYHLLLSTTAKVVEKIITEEPNVKHGKGWWYLPETGDYQKTRPLLVAHVDTLCKPFAPEKLEIAKGVITNPAGILGADDRAGVAACLELRRRHGVAVLLCDGEESGGWGAMEASDKAGALIKQHPYMIELDRQGYREVVFYRNEHWEFKDIFLNRGYWEFNGSFSDISILSRRLKLAGANVSIGFRYQHTQHERLHLAAYYDTIERLGKLIAENPAFSGKDALPSKYEHFYLGRASSVVRSYEKDTYKELPSLFEPQIEEEEEHEGFRKHEYRELGEEEWGLIEGGV